MIKTSTMMFLTQSVGRHVIKFHKVAVSLTLLLSINEYVSGGQFCEWMQFYCMSGFQASPKMLAPQI